MLICGDEVGISAVGAAMLIVARIRSLLLPPAQAPVTSKYVRGEILHGVFLIKAGKDKNTSEFTMVSHQVQSSRLNGRK